MKGFNFLPEYELHYYYDSKIKIYPNGIAKFRKYNRSLRSLESGAVRQGKPFKDLLAEHAKEYVNSKLSDVPKIKKPSNTSRNDSISRTRKKIYDYAICNDWTFFVTLTFEDTDKFDITDLNCCNKKLSSYLKRIKEHYPDLKYLGVPEFQKRGAVHYHLLLNVPSDLKYIKKNNQGKEKTVFLMNYHTDPLKLYDEDTKKNKILYYYDLPYWKWGYSSAIPITGNKQSGIENVTAYILKYIQKDNSDIRLFDRFHFFASQNLIKPTTIKLIANSNQCEVFFDFIDDEIGFYHFIPFEPYQIEFFEFTYKIDLDYFNFLE